MSILWNYALCRKTLRFWWLKWRHIVWIMDPCHLENSCSILDSDRTCHRWINLYGVKMVNVAMVLICPSFFPRLYPQMLKSLRILAASTQTTDSGIENGLQMHTLHILENCKQSQWGLKLLMSSGARISTTLRTAHVSYACLDVLYPIDKLNSEFSSIRLWVFRSLGLTMGSTVFLIVAQQVSFSHSK